MRSAMPAMCVRPVHRSVLSSGPSFAGTHRCAQHLVCEILQVRCQDVRGITAGRGWPLVSGWPGIICSLLPPGPTGQVHLAAEVFICFMMEVRPCLSRLRRSFEEALLDSTRLDSRIRFIGRLVTDREVSSSVATRWGAGSGWVDSPKESQPKQTLGLLGWRSKMGRHGVHQIVHDIF